MCLKNHWFLAKMNHTPILLGGFNSTPLKNISQIRSFPQDEHEKCLKPPPSRPSQFCLGRYVILRHPATFHSGNIPRSNSPCCNLTWALPYATNKTNHVSARHFAAETLNQNISQIPFPSTSFNYQNITLISVTRWAPTSYRVITPMNGRK